MGGTNGGTAQRVFIPSEAVGYFATLCFVFTIWCDENKELWVKLGVVLNINGRGWER